MKKLIHTCKPDKNGFTVCSCTTYKEENMTTTEKCNCQESTCRSKCNRNHTHKEFWCEKCHPERYEATTEKEERLREEWNKSICFPHDGKQFHRSETDEFYGRQIADWWMNRFSHQQEELIGKVINMVKKSDMAYMVPATEERFISDLENLIKEQSNGTSN